MKQDFCIAKDFANYKMFLRSNELTEQEVKYISKPQDLIGISPENFGHVYRIGAWNTRPDIDEIEAIIKSKSIQEPGCCG